MTLHVGGEIDQRGRCSFARVYASAGGRLYEGTGFAVADDHDPIDPALGETLAAGRALADLGRRMKRDAWRSVQVRDRGRRRAADRQLAALYRAAERQDRREARDANSIRRILNWVKS